MECRERRRGHVGGILSLADFANEHGDALEYDLMTRTRYSVSDVGSALSVSRACAFARQAVLDPSTAIHRSVMGEHARWTDGQIVGQIVADIFDQISMLRYDIASIVSKKGARPRFPDPYPRPGSKKRGGIVYGSDPIPTSEFHDWWDSFDKAKEA